MTLVLHQHPFASYCQKVLVALYELDVPFESEIVDGEDARARHAELWPLASIPVLRDTAADLTLPESTSIIEYLDADHQLIPADGLKARLWDRIIDGHVATPMQKIVGDSLRPEGGTDPTGVAMARDTLDTAYGVLDAQLADRPWLAGDAFTVADCAAAPVLFYMRAIHRWEQPNISRYYRDLVARPSFARVIEEARPFRGLFPLPWPEDQDDLTP